MTPSSGRLLAIISALALMTTACTGSTRIRTVPAPAPAPAPAPPDGLPPPPATDGGAGTTPTNVYSADGRDGLSPVVQGFPLRLYVPSGKGRSMQVIDPASGKVLSRTRTNGQPEHVVPSWDLRTLWLTNDQANTLTPIDPASGQVGKPIPVTDPYNLYFTPDGRFAIVVAERLQRLDFRDPASMALIASVPVPCPGVNHMDFSADGTYLVASCEFGAAMVKVDLASRQVVGRLDLPAGSQPQDVKLSPDGKRMFVADLRANGVFVLNGDTMAMEGLVATGKGAHAVYVSRDASRFYVTNRGEGTVSVLDPVTARVTATWTIPGPASPDMGGVTPDGGQLWLTGRYNSEIYAIDTTTGRLITRIPVPAGPHGMSVYPQPGRYSLGHTGILR